MSEEFRTNWTFGSDWTERPDRFHERAHAEARAASGYRHVEPEPQVAVALIDLLRQAFGGRPSTKACDCPA